MIHEIRKAWESFDECQHIADYCGFGSYWAQASLTRDKRELEALSEKMPDPALTTNQLLKCMCDGVSWMQFMQRFANTPEAHQMPTSYAAETAQKAIQHAIHVFGAAKEQYGFLQEEGL